MLEKIYTTKMSASKRLLKNRFTKIRAKSGRMNKLGAFVIFVCVLLAMAFVSLFLAARFNRNRYAMTDAELSDFIGRPIGSCMAELVYADENRIVFHYAEGFFVDDLKTDGIDIKINLKRLNLSYNQQGSSVLEVKIDKAGKTAYLSTVGPMDEIQGYEKYRIDLDNGVVKKAAAGENEEWFAGMADTYRTVQNPVGWYSNQCAVGENETYYLTSETGVVKDIRLVTILHQVEDLERYRYVFGGYYANAYRKKQDLIQETLSDGEEILINSGLSWEVNTETLKAVLAGLSEDRQMKYTDIKDGNFDVTIYQLWMDDVSYPRLFVIDNYGIELLFWFDLTEKEYADTVRVLNRTSSELYQKTSEFLAREFQRVYAPYYDIQNVTISNWSETENEAVFYYTMSYLHYNRDPDQAQYIKEAKERSREEYEALYKDYLALKQVNYEFKVVLKDEKIDLYTNVAPKGTEWVPIEIDDYIMSN